MKALALSEGDLVVRGGDFVTIEGARKVAQDVGVALREPHGADRFHPGWGSMLHSYLGHPISEEVRLLVNSEVRRVVSNYSAVQAERIEKARADRRSSRLGSDGVVTEVERVRVSHPGFDRLDVLITLATLGSARVTLPLSLEA